MDATGELHSRIFIIRCQRIMLDFDLAAVYGVTTKRLNEQVRRNLKRFPADFMFQLTTNEVLGMRPHFATASRRNVRYRPFAFTEHGAIMLASVLNSGAAIAASVQVVRAFVRLREMTAGHRDLARRVDELEKHYDSQFREVFDAIRELMGQPEKPLRRIGFQPQ